MRHESANKNDLTALEGVRSHTCTNTDRHNTHSNGQQASNSIQRAVATIEEGGVEWVAKLSRSSHYGATCTVFVALVPPVSSVFSVSSSLESCATSARIWKVRSAFDCAVHMGARMAPDPFKIRLDRLQPVAQAGARACARLFAQGGPRLNCCALPKRQVISAVQLWAKFEDVSSI